MESRSKAVLDLTAPWQISSAFRHSYLSLFRGPMLDIEGPIATFNVAQYTAKDLLNCCRTVY